MDILTNAVLQLCQPNTHLGDSLMTTETKKVILVKKIYASKYTVCKESILKTFQTFLKYHVYLLSLPEVSEQNYQRE